jgi:signal transduction histidine kinase
MIFLIFLCIYIPFSAIHRVSKQRKNQILYFAIGTTIYAVWAAFVSIILPFFGIAKLSDFDSPATIFMVGFTSYSIIKYHLMDISSLLFQAFIYASVIVLIIAFLLLLVFVSSYLFAHLLVWPIYVIIFVVAITMFFIGRLFFMEKRDLEEAKINLTESLKSSEESRKRAEAERDKTATIISNFSDGLMLLDNKDRVFSINREAEKILELDSKKLLGKPIQVLSGFEKAARAATVLNAGLDGISQKQVELAKDFIIELSVIPLNLDKKDIGHLIVLHDVSREKIVENMKTEFVSLAAHQLRTPLSIIKWSMSMLEKGDFGKLNQKQDEVVKRAFKNNERLISLVNDLLNVTRIEEGRYLNNIAMEDIKKIVGNAISDYDEEIKKKKIEVEFKDPGVLPKIMLDAEKIKLAVQNLIDNAVKYSSEGGKVTISLSNDDKNINFKIQDFGIGIPKSQQVKIFTKFFRGDNAEKVNTGGSGLGLFLTQNIIEAHGGKIWFNSESNKGTTFYFNLPIRKEAEQ